VSPQKNDKWMRKIPKIHIANLQRPRNDISSSKYYIGKNHSDSMTALIAKTTKENRI
jgi:hypothetical protein